MQGRNCQESLFQSVSLQGTLLKVGPFLEEVFYMQSTFWCWCCGARLRRRAGDRAAAAAAVAELVVLVAAGAAAP